jgi:hypothetical protein
MMLKRRKFLEKSTKMTAGVGLSLLYPWGKSVAMETNKIVDEKTYLSEILYTKQEVDDWFAGKAFPFSKYHNEFGWLLNNAQFRDGMDNSVSTYTYSGEDGERIMSNYQHKPCRINTYGNSYTQCHQVSDHETWQEILAAHLQEPVRNYGIGGWSVYQAYLRMVKEEKRNPAEYIIFNIYDDDHKRNLDSWRNIRIKKHPQHIEATLPYVKVNLKDSTIIECKNPCPTPDSVYKLCDIEETYEIFKDDFVLKIMLAHKNSKIKNPYQSYSDLMKLIKTHGIVTNIDNSETLAEEAEELHLKSALFSTKMIIEKIEKFAKKNNKKILYILSYPGRRLAKYVNEGIRFDQEIVDFLNQKKLLYVDLLEEHRKEFLNYRLDINDYINKYFIGHYNPLGNFFCAYALKNKLIELLDPKPFPYR